LLGAGLDASAVAADADAANAFAPTMLDKIKPDQIGFDEIGLDKIGFRTNRDPALGKTPERREGKEALLFFMGISIDCKDRPQRL
jgi:hypothetical protein